ncbi:MAG: exodeoxyribonuclease VII large subunit [Bacteroidales bacterium]|nr:exodeoxyribonuclease VII large subunit [Bacteroidales bacterium]
MLTYTDLFPTTGDVEACTLLEVADAVADALSVALPPRLWVVAEVAQVQVSSAGHCYLDLVERTAKGQTVAKMRANIWRGTYEPVVKQFVAVTGSPLTVGMQLMCEVEITHHAQFGLSLNVLGINAHYTIAQVMHRRAAIIEQLAKDGILHDNRTLALPAVLGRVAIISSDTAAGYGDFMAHLSQHAPHYNLTLRLFPAAMQGEHTELSVVAALQRIEAEADQWDAIAIIRGGGATTDLEAFDSYLIGAAIAQCSLPVLCGIGHERDYTVVDEVAHTRLKTPTDVAEFLVSHFRTAEHKLAMQCKHLHAALYQRVLQAEQRLTMQQQIVAQQFSSFVYQRTHALNTQQLRLRHAMTVRLATATAALQLAEQRIALASPERILALGYTLTTHKGLTLRTTQHLQAGDRLVTHTALGTVESVVLPGEMVSESGS